jgi:hypothetical protein
MYVSESRKNAILSHKPPVVAGIPAPGLRWRPMPVVRATSRQGRANPASPVSRAAWGCTGRVAGILDASPRRRSRATPGLVWGNVSSVSAVRLPSLRVWLIACRERAAPWPGMPMFMSIGRLSVSRQSAVRFPSRWRGAPRAEERQGTCFAADGVATRWCGVNPRLSRSESLWSRWTCM